MNSGAPLHYKASIPAVWIPLPEVNSGAPLHYKGSIPTVWIPLPEVNNSAPPTVRDLSQKYTSSIEFHQYWVSVSVFVWDRYRYYYWYQYRYGIISIGIGIGMNHQPSIGIGIGMNVQSGIGISMNPSIGFPQGEGPHVQLWQTEQIMPAPRQSPIQLLIHMNPRIMSRVPTLLLTFDIIIIIIIILFDTLNGNVNLAQLLSPVWHSHLSFSSCFFCQTPTRLGTQPEQTRTNSNKSASELTLFSYVTTTKRTSWDWAVPSSEGLRLKLCWIDFFWFKSIFGWEEFLVYFGQDFFLVQHIFFKIWVGKFLLVEIIFGWKVFFGEQCFFFYQQCFMWLTKFFV